MTRDNIPNIAVAASIHLAVWIGIMCVPYIMGIFYPASVPPLDWGMLVMPLQLMALFYLNYLFLINKLLFNKRIVAFLAVNLAVIVLLSLLTMAIRSNLHPFPDRPPMGRMHDEPRPGMGLPMVMGLATQLLIVGLSVAIRMTAKWYEARRRVAELEQENTRAELQQLKNQLNPHFLFNSLNNIYALIAFDPEKAQISLHSLCDMLRYQLYEANRETIPLQNEVEFVRNYCDLMRLRLAGNVTLELELPDEHNRMTIAPLLFVSIVENAFKHGVSPSQPSYIIIKITYNNGAVKCVVRNSYFPKDDRDRSGSGVGLDNLRRRLELLYPGLHDYRAEKIGSEFITQLTIRSSR